MKRKLDNSFLILKQKDIWTLDEPHKIVDWGISSCIIDSNSPLLVKKDTTGSECGDHNNSHCCCELELELKRTLFDSKVLSYNNLWLPSVETIGVEVINLSDEKLLDNDNYFTLEANGVPFYKSKNLDVTSNFLDPNSLTIPHDLIVYNRIYLVFKPLHQNYQIKVTQRARFINDTNLKKYNICDENFYVKKFLECIEMDKYIKTDNYCLYRSSEAFALTRFVLDISAIPEKYHSSLYLIVSYVGDAKQTISVCDLMKYDKYIGVYASDIGICNLKLSCSETLTEPLAVKITFYQTNYILVKDGCFGIAAYS